jgi:hypothetical protein
MIEPGWVVRDRPIVHVDPQSKCSCSEDEQAGLIWLLSNARLVVYALCAWLGMTAALVLFRLF